MPTSLGRTTGIGKSRALVTTSNPAPVRMNYSTKLLRMEALTERMDYS